MKTVEMKEVGMPLAQRFQTFPWMLSDLLFPLMMEYLVRMTEAQTQAGVGSYCFHADSARGPTALVVSYMGDYPERAGRTDLLR